MSIRKILMLSAFLLATVSLSLFDAQAAPETCNLSHGNCSVTVQMTVFTGSPTVPCLIGHPVIKVVANVTCGQSSAGPFETLKCGISSSDFVFSALGFTHTISLLDGHTWEEQSCDMLEYHRSHN